MKCLTSDWNDGIELARSDQATLKRAASMASASRTLLTRVIGFVVYILIGGAIFMEIEKDNDKHATTHTFEDLRSKWIQKYNLSKEIITELLQDYDEMRKNGAKPTWSFLDSVYFVLQLVATIGYGNIAPKTPSGQIFTIPYAIAGIPLTALALKSIGELVNIALRTINRPFHVKLHTIQCNEGSCDFLEKGNLTINSVCLMLTWIVASATSAYLTPEQSVITNAYSIFVIYSTVGFGDIIPFEEHKYVFMTIVLPGLSVMSSLINSIVAYVEKISILNQQCFSIPKCLSGEGALNSGIRADNFQQETPNVNELAV